ncbi:Txe/YoeB family addiction module toxin [Kingella kingae]|uniref:Txe/YoeB family addiction module toxin n=1 Tax=Kingella kingae TaxID=504 RepID=UPI0004224E9F|nr:Txe/YoeB family addiction module toxin [Kingella kingae]
MRLIFSDDAWQDYVYWQTADRKILKRINLLIQDIQREPFDGIGKPEPLRFNLAGFWSRRIDEEHRLVYAIENEQIFIVTCRYHYQP